MTDRRALKQLVRTRMARTGESSTTAHRHVTARAADRGLPGLTPGYPAFGADAHRPSGLARHLLAQAGVDLSEAMACGLGGGIGFLYAVFEYAQVPHPLLTIVAQHHPQPWLEAVAQHLGLTLTSVTSSKAGTALSKLDAALESGRAAEITVGRGLLPWHPGVDAVEAADPYPVVVAGKDGEEYLVDDGAAQPHRIGAQPLGEAWAAHRKGRFAVVTVDPPAGAPDLAGAVRAAVTTTHAHLTGPVLGNSFDSNIGLSGIGRFADDLADRRTKKGWARRFGTPEALVVGTHRLAECLTWAHTSGGATRPLYAQFLAEAAAPAGLDLSAASGTAAEAGTLWTELADLAGTTTTADDPAETIEALAALAAEIVPVEERLAAQLGAAIGAD
ncbi:BtrH N-terminal domain-containing protein [Georgenia subflava]|uniref:DUF4872 domain-containing protein n=1 Tax=Georgenia subflava TaxID=1622177 RepID=A0A6N7EFL6_9MICO|nr:BtrH N-terminal domain-containing protein [Georgenia subflava]MPV36181.1 DUF4872 domain-containing protein [Georgenia subflava]